MKTGIVTFHSAFNFGASLQTWALKETLIDLGHEPVIVNYRPEKIDSLYDPLYGLSGMERFTKKVSKRKSMERFRRYEAFIKERFPLTDAVRSREELQKQDLNLDACIVGSDQVWNIQHTGGDPTYFLDFLPEGIKKISYAASVGTDYLPPSIEAEFRAGLKDFSYISVREKSAKPLIETVTELPVDVVLDPTLLLKREDYEKLKKPSAHKEKYILVYMMERNWEVISFANRISKLLGIPIVQRHPRTIFRNEIQGCFTSTPGEFLDYVEQAELVITNSFHGTVFSLIYGKPFMSMLHSSTGSRTVDLLETVGLEDHLLYTGEDFQDLSRFVIRDPQKVGEKIEEQRTHSLEYLKRALG